MKLSDIEKSQLKVLYDMGFRFIVRDELGLFVSKTKPRLHIGINFKCWFTSGNILFLNYDMFKGVSIYDVLPYQITKLARLRLYKPKKKAVKV